MASNVNNCDNSITTDAQHVPPRSNQEIEENVEKDENEINNKTNENFNEKQSNNIPKSSKHINNEKNTPPAFAANVINITQSHGIHIGSNYTIMMNNPTKDKSKNIVETEAIQSLFNNKSLLKRNQLLFVSTHMDEGWRDTIRALNYSDGQISQFYQNHFTYGIKEVIYQCLLDWTRNEPDEATVSKLSRILWENDQKSVVQRWSLQE